MTISYVQTYFWQNFIIAKSYGNRAISQTALRLITPREPMKMGVADNQHGINSDRPSAISLHWWCNSHMDENEIKMLTDA